MRGASGRRAIVVTAAIAVLVAGVTPEGAIPEGQSFPLAWLWSWLRPGAAAGAAAMIGVPLQPDAGGAQGRGHYVTSEATRGTGGTGLAPGRGIGALDPWTPGDPRAGLTPAQAQTTPALMGENSFDATRSTRVAADSTATSDVYRNPDGSFTRKVFADPVNYRAPDGSWQPIDRTLVQAAGRIKPKADANAVDFAGRADGELATLRVGGLELGYGMQGAKPVAAQVNGDTLTYRDIVGGVDLKLTPTAQGVKESLVITKDAGSSWVFPLRLNGLTPRLEDSGAITLRDKADQVQLTIPRGYMQDSRFDGQAGEFTRSWGVRYELSTVDGKPALVVKADEKWLRDPARVYPVTIDPTTNFNSTGDTFARNDWPGDNSASDELLAGTYNAGTSKAHSFIHFNSFTASYGGARLSAASLKIFLSWAATCTPKPFTVHTITAAWTESGVTSYPGPAQGGQIGTATPDPGAACTNTGGDRNIGVWVTVPLTVATLQGWANGGTNNGLAVTASQSDSTQWKRFTSRNGPAGKGPYLSVTYTPGVPPQVDKQYPPAGYSAPTLTPELLVAAHDPDSWPSALTYDFIVYNSAGTNIAESGWTASRTWVVPAGKLTWGQSYSWTVGAKDGYFTSTSQRLNPFSTPVPQPLITSALAQNSGRGFEPSVGNYTTTAQDAVVATVGPALQIDRSYNSQDPRTTLAFGASWSSVLDARAREQRDAAGALQSVIVTYPGGQDVAFGRNSNGTFASAPGRFSSFTPVTGGYKLVDKDLTTYTFTGPNLGVSSIADAAGRTETFTYDANGHVTRIVSASGRALTMTWSGNHVATVANDANETWNYTYTGDLLAKVCSVGCTNYTYGTTSLYPGAVQNAAPRSYWRLGDAGGAVATSAVLDQQGTDSGAYTSVALGQSGPLPGSAALAAGFDGTASRVQLPSKLVTITDYQTVSLWFKTSVAGGVLFSYQADPLSNPTTPGNYTPSLYIGSSGKLYGEFWSQWGINPIVTPGSVADGAWHQVVLTAAGNTQSMYLDGALVETKTGIVQMIDAASAANIYVGGGFLGGGWPDEPHAGQSGNTGFATFFNGSIAEVGFFDRALSAPDIAAINAVGKAAAKPLTSIVRPSGNVSTSIAYDPVTGAVTQVTDGNGGVWKLGAPTVSGSSQVYAGAVLSGAPADYWRLAETGTVDAVNEVNGNTASYSTVSLGVANGPFADSTVAGFNGTSSYLQLPNVDAPGAGPASVSLWFKMPAGNTAGGVLYGYQSGAVEDPVGTTSWVPALYVGTDGKLHGHFWVGDLSKVMTSPGTVNDGNWHHAVLAASTNSQALYLDGARVAGPVSATLLSAANGFAYVGAGKWSGSWPAHSAAAVGYFPGQIAEVSFYRSQLSAAQAGAQFAARAKSNGAPVKTILVTDPGNRTIEHTFDVATGRQLSEVDTLGNKTQYGYDVAGFLRTSTDPNGNVTTSEHDARGNVVSQTTCQDRSANKCSTVYYTYDPVTDAVLTIRDGRSSGPADNTYLTTNAYDATGNRISVTDPLGRITKTEYTSGQPTKVTTPGGAVQTVEYAANGDVSKITDPVGKVTTFTYDAVGRVLSETEVTDSFPGGLTTRYTYDLLGRVKTQTDPAVLNRVTGATHTPVTTTVYDADGGVTSQTLSDTTGGDASRTESSTYNGLGQQVTSTDAAGKTTRFEYDAYGNVVKETEPDGDVTTNAYDAEGNLLSTTVVAYTGDPNNPSAARDIVVTSKAYDPGGRLASVTDAMGWVTSYTYTDNGLTASVKRTDPTSGASFVQEQNTYNAAGDLISQVTANGATTATSILDNAGRVTSSTLDPAGLKRTTAYEYDRDDNVVSATASDPAGVAARSETLYDAAGRPIAQSTHRSTLAPMGRWRLNETTGGTAFDSGGNSRANATGVTWSTAHGGSAVFNGTSSYVATAGPVLDTARSFTVSAWVNPTDATRNRAVLAQEGNAESGFYLKLDHVNGDKWSFVMYNYDDAASPNTYATSTSAAPLNAWTHLTAVFDGPNKTLKLYVNGALQTTKALVTGFAPWSSDGPLTIGRLKYHSNGTDYWQGSLSDVQAYSRLLTDAEISSVYAGTAPVAGAGVSRTSIAYDQDGHALATTDANGDVTEYSYDEDGEHVTTTSPAVSTESGGSPIVARPMTQAGYNTFGEQTESRDARGFVTVTDYDAAGRALATHLPSYTPPGSGTPLNPVITNSYDVQGQLTSTVDGLGNTTRFVYDQLGRLAKATAPNLGETKYSYDLLGDRLSTVDPNGATITATYDFLGRPLTSTQVVRQTGASHITTFGYGLGGWLNQQTSPGGVVTKSSYNAVGETITSTDGANNVTSFTYDGAGRRVRTTLPDNTYSVVAYDLAGNDVSTKSYDAANALLSSQSTEYDAESNVVASVDAKGTRLTFKYDASGMITSETQPVSATDSIVSSFGYDVNGNRTRFTDGRGSIFLTTYNSWNLPESQIEPATTRFPSAADRTFTVAYDAGGQVKSQSYPGGVSVANTYDALGNITRQTGTGAEAPTVDRIFGYDPGGRLTSVSAPGGTDTFGWDDRGLLTSATGPSGAATFGYNADGAMVSRNDAAGATTYNYDTAGRITGIANSGNAVQVGYGYNNLSQVNAITYGGTGNKRTIGYDSLHRLTSDELKTPVGASIGKITYGYDPNGNETSKTTTGFAGASANTYTYDLADRLTSWNSTIYAYDKAGNRSQAGAKTFTYDERNQLITADGSTYNYTPRGSLSTVVSGGSSYLTQTDAFGEVARQDAAGGSHTYNYDAFGRLIQTGFAYSGLGNTLASDAGAKYTRDSDNDLVGVGTTLAWTDQHTDVVGQFTATGTVLSGSTSYDPLGQVTATSGMIGNLGFQSSWTDFTTGRVNMWQRWYNTLTGQFDTRDPIDLDPVPDSVNANRFAYGDDNPLTTTDPTGHWGLGSLWKKAKSTVSSAWHATTSYVSSAWNYSYSYASYYAHYTYQAVKHVAKTVAKHVSRAYHAVKRKVSHAYHAAKRWVKHTYHSVKRWVKHTYHAAKRWVKHTYHAARKFVAHKIHQVKHAAAKIYHKVKQAGRAVIAKTARIAHKVGSAVKDAYNATEKWVKDHKNAIIEAVAIGAGILAGIACTAATAGAGAVACMVGAAAVINLAKDAAQGDIHNWGDAFGSLGTGAVQGLAGFAGGAIGGKIAGAVLGKLGGFAGSLGGRMLGGAAAGATGSAAVQLAMTGHVSLTGVLIGAGVGAVTGGFSRGSPGKSGSPQDSVRHYRFGDRDNPYELQPSITRESAAKQAEVAENMRDPAWFTARGEAHAGGRNRESPFLSLAEDPARAAGTTDDWLRSIGQHAPDMAIFEGIPASKLYTPTNSLSLAETEVLFGGTDLSNYLVRWVPNPYRICNLGCKSSHD
jgi:RHS repeat-associated protein